MNEESEKLESQISAAVQVTGSMKPELKEERLMRFIDGDIQKMISKPSIFGFGINLQNCRHVVFVGLSDSWEKYYQAIRRCWRFGQEKVVHVHVIAADTEGGVVANIKRKELHHQEMSKQMVDRMSKITMSQIKKATIEKTEYTPKVTMKIPHFLRISA